MGEEEAMHVKLDELAGLKVFDANGRVIGAVKAALVDMETWQVDTLRIGVDRHAAADLDMGWSFWAFWRRPTPASQCPFFASRSYLAPSRPSIIIIGPDRPG